MWYVERRADFEDWGRWNEQKGGLLGFGLEYGN